jgi:hypothetical protein
MKLNFYDLENAQVQVRDQVLPISLDEEITNMQATLNELMVWYFAFNFVYD